MKSNNKMILVCGDLASGKSTIANQIAIKYKLPCYNKDTVKEILGDNFGFSNREENLKLSYCSFSLFAYFASKNMQTGISFIIESNFRQKELDKLAKLAKEYHYEILSIVFYADIHILHERFLKRINEENRHLVHRAVDFSKYEDFEMCILESRKRIYPGVTLFKDAAQFVNIDNIASNVEKFLEV